MVSTEKDPSDFEAIPKLEASQCNNVVMWIREQFWQNEPNWGIHSVLGPDAPDTQSDRSRGAAENAEKRSRR
jgi:hypothetical protein